MSSLKLQIMDEFEVVRRQRDAALRDLGQAQQTISLLEAEIDALKYYADLTYAKVAEEQGLSKFQVEGPAVVKISGPSACIDEIWICSAEAKDVLRPAEEAWKKNLRNPQSAILLARKLLPTVVTKTDSIRVRLFLAAIQVSAGSAEPVCDVVTGCIKECGTDPRYKDLMGIALYIRGRAFAAMKMFSVAHWDLSRAVLTPGYNDLVKKWQGLCETWIKEAEFNRPCWRDPKTKPIEEAGHDLEEIVDRAEVESPHIELQQAVDDHEPVKADTLVNGPSLPDSHKQTEAIQQVGDPKHEEASQQEKVPGRTATPEPKQHPEQAEDFEHVETSPKTSGKQDEVAGWTITPELKHRSEQAEDFEHVENSPNPNDKHGEQDEAPEQTITPDLRQPSEPAEDFEHVDPSPNSDGKQVANAFGEYEDVSDPNSGSSPGPNHKVEEPTANNV